jgi:hypothetical protein
MNAAFVPKDILFHILSFIPLLDLIPMSRMCKEWYQHINNVTKKGNPILYNLGPYGLGILGRLEHHSHFLFHFRAIYFSLEKIQAAIDTISYKYNLKTSQNPDQRFSNEFIISNNTFVICSYDRDRSTSIRQKCDIDDFQPYSILKMFVELYNARKSIK